MTKSEFFTHIAIEAMDTIRAFSSAGKNICFETNQGRYLNIAPSNFKFILQKCSGGKSVEEILKAFRRMELILSDEEKRFTNVQKYKGKSRRVVTIHLKKYEFVLEFNTGEYE